LDLEVSLVETSEKHVVEVEAPDPVGDLFEGDVLLTQRLAQNSSFFISLLF